MKATIQFQLQIQEKCSGTWWIKDDEDTPSIEIQVTISAKEYDKLSVAMNQNRHRNPRLERDELVFRGIET